MKCGAARRLIDAQLDGELAPDALAGFARHRADCPDCQLAWDTAVELRAGLAALPVEPPKPGFEARVLARSYVASTRTASEPAGPAYRTRRRWRAAAGSAIALAASALIAVGLWRAWEPPTANVMTRAGEPLSLVFRSSTTLRDVTIEIALPDGSAIRGHPNIRQISWQSDLLAGTNVLELPLDVAGVGGLLIATITHEGERRAFQVRVRPAFDTRTEGAGDA
jgi:anti-sigma factor RsiW